MTELEVSKLAEAILEKLRKSHHTFWIDPEVHSQQHEFIKELIEERVDKLARRKAVEDKIAGSIILSGILVIIGLLGAGALSWLKGAFK